MSSSYFEQRPVYCGEINTITATIPGSGSLTGTYAGHLYDPNGTEVAGAVTVTIADANARTLTVTVSGQAVAGDFALEVRRTDGSSDLCVVRGVIEVTDPSKR